METFQCTSPRHCYSDSDTSVMDIVGGRQSSQKVYTLDSAIFRNSARSGTEFSDLDWWKEDENTIDKETDKMIKINGGYLLSGHLGDKLKNTAHLLSRDEKFISLIILQEEKCHLARLEGSSEPSSSSTFVNALETTTFVRQHRFHLEDANKPVKVTLDNYFRSKSSDSSFEYVIHGTEKFYEEKVKKEIDLVYRHCKNEDHVKVDLEDISHGDIAVAFDEATGKYHRVKLLAGLQKKELGIRCKLLDDFGEMRAFEESLFKLLSYYDFPPMVKQMRLEHLWHYDSFILQKMYLEVMLLNTEVDEEVKVEKKTKINTKTQKNSHDHEFYMVFTGRTDPDGLPLCFLLEENPIFIEGYENEQETKPESTNVQGNPNPRNINDVIMNKLIEYYKAHKLFRKTGENRDLSVSYVKTCGSVFLQNRRHPMYKHMYYLLSKFHPKKDTLKPVERTKVKRNEIYLAVTDDNQVFRALFSPLRNPKRYSKKDHFFVQFYDGGDPIICVDTLYLASDVDPYLSLLPPQYSEVKLFNIPLIPQEHLSFVKSMFPPNLLFRAVTVKEVIDDKGKFFVVELFKIPLKRLDESQKQPQLAPGTEEPYFEGKYVPYTPHDDFTSKRRSINVEILELIQNEKEKEHLTRKPPMTQILKMKWENPRWEVGKVVTAFVDDVFDFDDFVLIDSKDLEKRNSMDVSLNSYMSCRASIPPTDRIPWNYVTRKYIEDFPHAIFIAPIAEGRFGRAFVVISNPLEPPKELYPERNDVKVLFIDYGVFKEVPVDEMKIISDVKYLRMPPLAVCAKTSEKAWKTNTKKGFKSFKTLKGNFLKVKVKESSLDKDNMMKVTVRMLNFPKNTELQYPPTL